MDLKPLPDMPTAAERAAVDAVVGDFSMPGGLREALGRRHWLLPVLHGISERVGWISRGALGYACERLHIPPAEAYGVASFYALFALSERAPTCLHLCDDLACKANGADALAMELTRQSGEAGVSRKGAQWQRSNCLGLCEAAPAVMRTVAGPEPTAEAWGHATIEQCAAALKGAAVPGDVRLPLPRPSGYPDRLLERMGRVDPTSLGAYRAAGGYTALARALELGGAAVIAEISAAGLVGRGGAAFPTGRKWAAVAQKSGAKYVVCNADESEPGTFKDRVIMESDPFALIEAITIAGLSVGAELGFLYLRGEYPLARSRIMNAIAQARAAGLLGDAVMGRHYRFDIELRLGAGAYICGEETALFASLEGWRGEPRTKPPFPVDVGLFGRPTVINNVETLVNVLPIVLRGAADYRSVGTTDSPGTRLFCVSGNVKMPGLYELPHGVTVRTLLALAGAPADWQTVLLGGAAGTFITPADADLPLSFEATRTAGATLGSGVVLVLGANVDGPAILRRIAHFFRDESCGQCVPCRLGTVQQDELLRRGGPQTATERAAYAELSQAMRDASICGLGQTASSAIESALRKLPIWTGPTS